MAEPGDVRQVLDLADPDELVEAVLVVLLVRGRLLVRRVEYDGDAGTVSLVFHPEGVRVLADEVGAGVGEEVMA